MELIDIVNELDEVIGTSDVKTAHELRLHHRVIAVYVVNSNGKILLQEHLSSEKRLDHSVGGHVESGEDYLAAAVRECREELNLDAKLTRVCTFLPQVTNYNHHFAVYECKVPEDWKFEPNDEVKVLHEFSLDEIQRMAEENPNQFTQGFLNTFPRFLAWKRLQSYA